MKGKVLILGGYGNFGKIISKGLSELDIPIIVAGRSEPKAKQYASSLLKQNPKASVQSAVIDVNKNLTQFLAAHKSSVVINTCGPFQPFSQTNFNVIRSCIDSRVNYIDLSDGRQFVREIQKFNKQAQQQNIIAITGASTAPGLSSALLQKFMKQFKQIDRVYYGFSPGQKSTRGGEATAKGVMSYVGKKIDPYGDFKNTKYGWQNLYAQNYPGVGTRLMGNIDHPDLDIFPKKYGINNIQFHAGVQSKMLHMGIWLASWMVRLGLPVDLPKNSGTLLDVSHKLFNWMGSDVGVMHFVIEGINKKGNKLNKTWYLIARDGDGPNVATVPAILLASKIYHQKFKKPGVTPCAGLVGLDQYLNYLKRFKIETFEQQKQS